MRWDKEAQLRHSAICTWRSYLMGRRRAEVLRIRDHLQELGYEGCIANLSADSILEGWKKAGWISVSPNRCEIRLTPDGEEQLAQWQEEDQLWNDGAREELEMPKRLKAGEPATNLRRICQVIGKRTIERIHDPYIQVPSLQNLLKMSELGAAISPHLRLLGAILPKKPKIDGQTLVSFLQDINTEKSSHWEARTYTTPETPHRRFLICVEGSIVTCGMSLNNINKDEVLELIPTNDKRADHDREFFEEKWKLAGSVA